MTALEKWKNDFKEFISELSIPRDDYKGIMEYINEVPNEASEQQPCKDWHDVPSDEMTLEQARQAVKDLRKKLAEYLWQEPCEDFISRKMAIEAIKEIQPIDTEYDSTLYDKVDVMYILHSLPSVKPQTVTDFADKCKECGKILNEKYQQKWIPVSERLPEEDGMYLISTCMNCIDTCLFYKDDDGYLWVDYEESVIAWMPLPAPYQPPKMMCEED